MLHATQVVTPKVIQVIATAPASATQAGTISQTGQTWTAVGPRKRLNEMPAETYVSDRCLKKILTALCTFLPKQTLFLWHLWC